MISSHPHLILSCIGILIAAAPSQAATVIAIDNLAVGSQSFSASLSGPTATSFFGGDFSDREVAFSFTTGSIDAYLTELKFVTSIGNAQLSPIQLTLSTGTSVPGGVNPVVLGSVAPASSSPITQTLTVGPTIPPVLLANTTYWIHMTVPTGGGIYSIANTNTPIAEPGWSLGTTWLQDPLDPWSELTSGPVARIRMTVETIPEPQAALLGGLGIIALLRRRR